MAKSREIRNSTVEFLIFQIEGKEKDIEVYYKDKTIWCTQKVMATLFEVNIPAISKHLKNIFGSGELKEDALVSKMEITAFRQWATSVLTEHFRSLFPMNDSRTPRKRSIVESVPKSF